MKIQQQFPFEFCNKCELMDINTNVLTFHADNELIDRDITVSCKNAGVCLQLRAMIRDQEGVVPEFVSGDGQFLCGNCKTKIGVSGVNYCHNCGKAVKWT